MSSYVKGFEDIPGTVIFDTVKSRLGYHLNMFCMALMKPDNRAAFKADEAGYLGNFPMTEEQRQAVLARDYNRMVELGGNIFFLIRIGATDGKPVASVVAEMTGATEQEHRQMMSNGGRPIEGNRSILERGHHG
ncbi:protocatechuate 4,5-dioxygenase subunit alpha [Eoetvoesiella caeni]